MSPKLITPGLVPGAAYAAGFVLALGLLAAPLAAQNTMMDPAAAAAAAQTPGAVVDKPLTPPTNDTPGEQPSSAHVWVPGHWRWLQGTYVWVAGQWQLPPVPNATWVAPQWQPQGGGYVLREGYWQPALPPGAAQPQGEISTTQPPPPPQPEVIPERPSPDHVWIPGYWDWRDNQFAWVGGRWEIPPRQDVTWVPAHWETRNGRYFLVTGYWHDALPQLPAPAPAPQVVVAQPAPAAQVIVVAPPPAPRVEPVYSRPSRYDVWVPGYWAWHGGRYVWISGHWERPPRGRHAWEAPRWERRGGNYVFIEGHWR